MKLNTEQIIAITQGAVKIAYEDGRHRFLRLSEEEIELTETKRYECTAGIQMEFRTDGSLLKLKGNTKWRIPARSYFSFDIFVDTRLVGCIKNFNDEACVGKYSEQKYETGPFCGEFELGEGEKSVRIIFPHSVFADIEEIELVGASYIQPIKRDKLIVAYGDSVTQGYDALHPSKTYAMKLADYFGAELINKGIGGATFSLNLPKIKNTLSPEFVVVAFGTNDWGMSDPASLRKNADAFLESVEANYPQIPVFVITPLWRTDLDREKPFGKFSDVERIINEVSRRYKNVKLISGMKLVPHDESLFGDLWLHPTEKGFEHYFSNLIKEITGR